MQMERDKKDEGEQKREQFDMVAFETGMFVIFWASNLNMKKTQQGPKKDITIFVEGENCNLAAV